jgi:hypothetical protein
MARGPCTFRQVDVERALRAAKAVGVPVDIRIDRRTGDLVIMTKRADDGGTDATSQNEWDAPPADEMHR